MRPVWAGTTADQAPVAFEPAVGNAGTVAAEDVRIATWLLARAGSEMESALIEPSAAVAAVKTLIALDDGPRDEVEARIEGEPRSTPDQAVGRERRARQGGRAPFSRVHDSLRRIRASLGRRKA